MLLLEQREYSRILQVIFYLSFHELVIGGYGVVLGAPCFSHDVHGCLSFEEIKAIVAPAILPVPQPAARSTTLLQKVGL